MRSEQAVFAELAEVCSSPGYIHAIAHFCFRDTTISYSGEMTTEDMLRMFSPKCLNREEIFTLIGLLLKNAIDFGIPNPTALKQYMEKTEALLEEIHNLMLEPYLNALRSVRSKRFQPSGAALREAIFYAPDSAYGFQFRDLSPKKYARDNSWLMANQGFSITTARDIVHGLGRMHNEKLGATARTMRGSRQSERTSRLPGLAP